MHKEAVLAFAAFGGVITEVYRLVCNKQFPVRPMFTKFPRAHRPGIHK